MIKTSLSFAAHYWASNDLGNNIQCLEKAQGSKKNFVSRFKEKLMAKISKKSLIKKCLSDDTIVEDIQITPIFNEDKKRPVLEITCTYKSIRNNIELTDFLRDKLSCDIILKKTNSKNIKEILSRIPKKIEELRRKAAEEEEKGEEKKSCLPALKIGQEFILDNISFFKSLRKEIEGDDKILENNHIIKNIFELFYYFPKLLKPEMINQINQLIRKPDFLMAELPSLNLYHHDGKILLQRNSFYISRPLPIQFLDNLLLRGLSLKGGFKSVTGAFSLYEPNNKWTLSTTLEDKRVAEIKKAIYFMNKSLITNQWNQNHPELKLENYFSFPKGTLGRKSHEENKEAGSNRFLISQLLPSGDLDSSKDLKEINPPGLLKIMIHLLDGIRSLHASGKVHRDIKPKNIFIDLRGETPIVKYGDVDMMTSATQPLKSIIGTPLYISPKFVYNTWFKEIKNENLIQYLRMSNDLFALGVTFIYLIESNKTLFNNDSSDLTLFYQITDEVGRTNDILSSLGILQKKEPNIRPQATKTLSESFEYIKSSLNKEIDKKNFHPNYQIFELAKDLIEIPNSARIQDISSKENAREFLLNHLDNLILKATDMIKDFEQ